MVVRDWYMEAGGLYKTGQYQYFGRNIMVKPSEVWTVRDRFGNSDVYATVYMYNSEPQSESELFGPFYVDLDRDIYTEEDYGLIKRDLGLVVQHLQSEFKIPEKYMSIYFSGSKGFHVTVPADVMGVKPDKQLNMYYKYMADYLQNNTLSRTVDTRIYDNRRLFRLPNSINSKTGLYKVPVSLRFALSATLEEMREYASNPREEEDIEVPECSEAATRFRKVIDDYSAERASKKLKRGDGSQPKGEPLPCVVKILENGSSKGCRNNTTVLLASSMFQLGMDSESVEAAVLEWNDEKNSPKLSSTEIIRTVRSAGVSFESKRLYGCGAAAQMGYCVGKTCKLYSK